MQTAFVLNFENYAHCVTDVLINLLKSRTQNVYVYTIGTTELKKMYFPNIYFLN